MLHFRRKTAKIGPKLAHFSRAISNWEARTEKRGLGSGRYYASEASGTSGATPVRS